MTALVSREGDSLSTGHICAATTTLDTPGQGDVYANSSLIARKTDPTVPHPFPPSPPCANHTATVGAGSPTVFVHGKRATFITAAADAGAMTGGASNVYVATAAAAVAKHMGVEVFAPAGFTATELDAFAQDVYDGIETAIADLGPEVAAKNEVGEYGDGGIPSARFNNTSPTNNVTGPQDAGPSSSTFEICSSPSLNFLPHTDARIDPAVCSAATALASAVGYTLDITSAFRSPAYNKGIGGVSGSVHQIGLAIDVIQTGKTNAQRQAFVTAAYNAGFRGIGIYNSFTHIDLSNKRAWGPNTSRTSLPSFPWAQNALGPLGYLTS